jgi:5'-nucleotidase
MLQISSGFSYSWTEDPVTKARTLGPVLLDPNTNDNVPAAPIDDAATYRVVTNNFVADGGDGLPGFRDGAGRFFGGLDIDAFANYLEDHSPYSPVTEARITKN